MGERFETKFCVWVVSQIFIKVGYVYGSVGENHRMGGWMVYSTVCEWVGCRINMKVSVRVGERINTTKRKWVVPSLTENPTNSAQK